MKTPRPTSVPGKDRPYIRLVLSAVVILCCPVISAAQDFPGLDAFFKSILKDKDRFVLEARGDLNGDALEDWAGVIERQKSEFLSSTQLYVLLRLREVAIASQKKSREEDVRGMGCCWVEGLKIHSSSIYIQNNAKTAGTMEAATHQFKLYQGKWRLVGVRIFKLDIGADYSVETDMNLLTGSVIEKRQKGENKPKTRSRRKKFSSHFLKDFDFYNGFGIE